MHPYRTHLDRTYRTLIVITLAVGLAGCGNATQGEKGDPGPAGPPGAKGDVPDLGKETCTAYVEAVNGKYVPRFGKPGQPFVCSQNNPLPATLDSSTLYYRPAKPGEALPTTATVPTTDPATP